MFDFNSWEFLALGVAAILIFGPERLPGMIRKAGEYYAQLQSVANTFRRELEAEVGEVTGPLKEAAGEISSAGQQVAEAGRDVSKLAVEAGTVDAGTSEAGTTDAGTAEAGPSDGAVTAEPAPVTEQAVTDSASPSPGADGAAINDQESGTAG